MRTARIKDLAVLSACLFLCGNAVAIADSAVGLTPEQKAIVAKYKISAKDQADLFSQNVSVPKAPKPEPAGATDKAAPASDAKDNNDCNTSPWNLLIRADFKDVDTLGCATPASQATGAKFSFVNDQVTNNILLSAAGTVAAVYTQFGTTFPNTGPVFQYDSFGAFATVNYAYNSSAALSKKNANTLKLGAVGEVNYARLLGANDQDFRFSGSDVHDSDAGTDAASVALEWLPSYGKIGIPNITPTISSLLTPELALRYDSAMGPHQVVPFSGKNMSLRVGPEVDWLLYGSPGSDFKSFHLELVGDLDYEVLSARWLPYFDAALGYNLDASGNLSLTAEYSKGTDPDFGTAKDQMSLGLTGKL